MTTLAFDGQIIATDTRISGLGNDAEFLKIFVGRDGNKIVCIAGCGVAAMFAPSVAWFLQDGSPANYPSPEMKLLCVTNTIGNANPRVVVVENHGHKLVVQSPHAEGSGADVAIGALRAGANAMKAIEIAALYDGGTCSETVAFNVITGEWINKPTPAMEERLQFMMEPYIKVVKAPRRTTKRRK